MPMGFPLDAEPHEKEEPRCGIFGRCGGCAYQHVTYEAELRLKSEGLRRVLTEKLSLEGVCVEPVTASPDIYHSRSRLDISMVRRAGVLQAGFMTPGSKNLLEIDSCPIAREEITRFIPELKRQAEALFPPEYRTANLVVKTGDDGRVLWGGIGKRSLEMKPQDYFWTRIRGRKIFYSLDTFFQANLSILPLVMDKIEPLIPEDERDLFLDLYGGVGLFGISLADLFRSVVVIEESPASIQMAYYNRAAHDIGHVRVHEGRVEDALASTLAKKAAGTSAVAMIDPPRQGLSTSVLETLVRAKALKRLFYLSCNPESLARDLAVLTGGGWTLERIMPFDFFPRTSHLETLALLRPQL